MKINLATAGAVCMIGAVLIAFYQHDWFMAGALFVVGWLMYKVGKWLG